MVFSRVWAWHKVQTLTSWVTDSVIDPPSHTSPVPAPCQPLCWQPHTQSCLRLVLGCGGPCLVGSQGNRPLQHRAELLEWAVLNKS